MATVWCDCDPVPDECRVDGTLGADQGLAGGEVGWWLLEGRAVDGGGGRCKAQRRLVLFLGR